MEASARLAGKRAVITGAGSGIGRAAAIRFAAEGARVGLIDVDEGASKETATMVDEGGGVSMVLTADVRDEDQVAAAVGQAVSAWQGLDVVVGNAGVELFRQHHIGDVDRAFALDNRAVRMLLALALMFLDHLDAFDNQALFVG